MPELRTIRWCYMCYSTIVVVSTLHDTTVLLRRFELISSGEERLFYSVQCSLLEERPWKYAFQLQMIADGLMRIL